MESVKVSGGLVQLIACGPPNVYLSCTLQDIDNMRAMPDKLAQNMIQIELMERSIRKMETSGLSKNNRLVICFSLICALDVLDNFVFAKLALAAVTFVMLYK